VLAKFAENVINGLIEGVMHLNDWWVEGNIMLTFLHMAVPM